MSTVAYQFNADGSFLARTKYPGPAPDNVLPTEGKLLFITSDVDEISYVPGRVWATIAGGIVESIHEEPGPAAIYLHIFITGADGQDPPGCNVDGTNPLQISGALRQGEHPASAVVPVSLPFLVPVRRSDRREYDVKRITLVAGEFGPVDYSGNPAGDPGVCEILERDLEPVTDGGQTYIVKIVGSTKFKLYGEL